ncbi:hypothetical protein GCM10010358_74090 [Streptomyces minutiscleroticus]|uniref:Uncharacterized protein n=1 Tax=Streptomyces minutiscleroticus TaxID=68238 RepID=A0A918P0W1_9ACTN|nr:hypothetical protein GCM10010358_74090 [Streptomyces minutiscleroticus]
MVAQLGQTQKLPWGQLPGGQGSSEAAEPAAEAPGAEAIAATKAAEARPRARDRNVMANPICTEAGEPEGRLSA